jgi:hypothetical protein
MTRLRRPTVQLTALLDLLFVFVFLALLQPQANADAASERVNAEANVTETAALARERAVGQQRRAELLAQEVSSLRSELEVMGSELQEARTRASSA